MFNDHQSDLLRVKQGAVSSKPHFINDSRFQVYKHSSGNMFAGASLREEGVEAVISSPSSFIARHGAIWLNPWT